jgi:hypothetical protein
MQPDGVGNEMDVFHFDAGRPSFEDLGHDGDSHFWYARDLMVMLGYESYNDRDRSLPGAEWRPPIAQSDSGRRHGGFCPARVKAELRDRPLRTANGEAGECG